MINNRIGPGWILGKSNIASILGVTPHACGGLEKADKVKVYGKGYPTCVWRLGYLNEMRASSPVAPHARGGLVIRVYDYKD